MEAHEPTSRTAKSNSTAIKAIGITGIVLVSLAFGFFGGMAYQKNQKTTLTQSGYGMISTGGGPLGAGSGGGMMRRGGTVGTVSAVSSSTISVQNIRTGVTSTLSIDATTVITNNGVAATANDIKVGDTVIITTSTTDTKKASRIIVNPSTAGPAQGQSTSDAPTIINN